MLIKLHANRFDSGHKKILMIKYLLSLIDLLCLDPGQRSLLTISTFILGLIISDNIWV